MEDYEPRENQETQPAADTNAPSQSGNDIGADLVSEMADQTEMSFVSESGGHSRGTLITVAALLLIGAAVIGFMRLKSAPKAAQASAPEAKQASATITTFLSDGSKNSNALRDLMKNTEKLRQQFLSYPLRKQIKLEDLQTNPFLFGKQKTDDPDADKKEIERKNKLAHEKLRAETREAAGQLKIQSIMAGSVRTAMINNKMCQEGQDVDGFKIVKINPDGVVVTKNSFTFTLRMVR